jgi:PAS domain S-box-containing protein
MSHKAIHVLSIEDNPADAMLIQEKLAEAQRVSWDLPHFEVEHVGRMGKALERLDDSDFDVVLSDLDLPDSRAGETVATLREHIPQMPLVVLTGREDEELAHKSVRAGVQDYLYKGESTGSLLARTMIYAIERQKSKQALQEAYDTLEHRVEERTAELARANEILREKEALLDATQKMAHVGGWAFDVETRKQTWTEETYRIHEISSDHRPTVEEGISFFPAEAEPIIREAVQRAVEEGESYELELPFVTAEGKRRWVRTMGRAIQKDGETVKVTGVIQDITERKRAEKALRKSEEEYRTLLQNIQAGVVVHDADTKVIEYNAKARELLGLAEEQAMGKAVDDPTWQFLREDGTPMPIEEYPISRVFSTDQPFRDLMTGIRRPVGDVVWVTVSADPVHGEEDDIVRVIVTFMDVTERKRAEEKLRESETKFRTLVDQAPEALFLHDMDGQIVDVNQIAVERYGYTREELLEMRASDIDPDYVEREDHGAFWRRVKEQKQLRFEARHRRSDGTILPVVVSLSVIELEGDEHVLALAEDITERKRMEEALRESEERYRRLVEISPDSIVLADLEGRILICNQQTASLHGIGRAEEVIGENVFAFIAPEDRERARLNAQKVLDDVEVENAEYAMIRKDGSRFFAEVNAALITDAAGQPEAFIGITRDITERRRAEEKLRESEEHFRMIIQRSPIGVGVVDSEGNMIDCNPVLTKMVGYSREKLLQMSFEDFTHPDDLKREWQLIEELWDEKAPEYRMEKRYIHKDGRTIWVDVAASLFRGDVEGGAFGFAFVRDITERKRTEEKLREVNDRLQGIMAHSPALITLMDEQGRYLMANRAVEKLMGVPKEEIVGESFDDLWPPEMAEQFFERLERVLETRAPCEVEDSWQAEDEGEERVYRTILFPLLDQQGQPYAVGGIASDITEQRRAENQGKRRLKELQFLNQSLLTLASLPTEDAIYRYIGERLSEYLEDAIITVNENAPASHTMTIQGIYGLGTPLINRALNVLGYSPVHKSYRMRPDAERVFQMGELRRFEGGLARLADGYTPPSVVKRLQTLLKIHHVYLHGLVRGDELYAGVQIYTRRGTVVENPRLIETFLHQASIALERRRAEMELRASEERAQKYLNVAGTMIVALDEEGQVTLINKRGCEILGYEEDEIVGRSWFDTFLPSRIRSDVSDVFETLMSGDVESVSRAEGLVLTKDGEERLILWQNAILRDDAGQITGTLSSGSDITERKRMERALRESEERYRLLAETARDMICVHDLEGNIQYLNQAGLDFIGRSEEEALTMNVVDFIPSSDLPAMEKRAYRRLAGNGGRYLYEAELVGLRGQRVPVEISSSPIVRDGEITSILLVARDITERRQAQMRIERYAQELERSNQALEQFAYVASHDLREPLRVITGYLELLDKRHRDQLGAKADEYMEHILEATDRMRGMIRALLDLSRVNTDGRTLLTVDCENILKQALSNLQQTIEENNAEVTWESLPAVMGDAEQLVLVFQNLVSNAIKFRKESERPRVHVSAERGDEEEWIFSVEDNGIGIDPEQADRIFQIFQRLHTQEEYEGTGIGLALCKRIVERHGGRIWVASEVGHGSTFTFTLPARPKA